MLHIIYLPVKEPMLNMTSNIKTSEKLAERNPNSRDNKWVTDLLKLFATTVALITLAVVSVSDGNLVSSQSQTGIHHTLSQK